MRLANRQVALFNILTKSYLGLHGHHPFIKWTLLHGEEKKTVHSDILWKLCNFFNSSFVTWLIAKKSALRQLLGLKMKIVLKTAITAAVLCMTAGVALADAHATENPMVGGAEMFAKKNIIENAINSADHTTHVAAVQAVGLVETLSGPGPFTVFAHKTSHLQKKINQDEVANF